MRGFKRRDRASGRGAGPVTTAMAPPPPPPGLGPAAAVATPEGPTSFAFPAPLPEEATAPALPLRPPPSGGRVTPKDVFVALAAVAAVVTLRLATGRGLSPYGLGQSFGMAFAGLLLAYGARQLYLRKAGKNGPAWSVSLIPVAVVLALAGQFTIFNTTSSVPDEAAVQATLVPLEGLEYQPAPANAVEELEAFLAGLPDVGDEMGAVEARLLAQGGRPAGVVVVFSMAPDALQEMDRASFRAGLQMNAGGRVVEKKRGPARTFEVKVGPLYTATFLDEDGFIFSVQTFNKRTAIKVSKTLAAANL